MCRGRFVPPSASWRFLSCKGTPRSPKQAAIPSTATIGWGDTQEAAVPTIAIRTTGLTKVLRRTRCHHSARSMTHPSKGRFTVTPWFSPWNIPRCLPRSSTPLNKPAALKLSAILQRSIANGPPNGRPAAGRKKITAISLFERKKGAEIAAPFYQYAAMD
jgi:hypothetical protein